MQERESPSRLAGAFAFCTPEQVRTAVSALRGRCPGPLDDGGKTVEFYEDWLGYQDSNLD